MFSRRPVHQQNRGRWPAGGGLPTVRLSADEGDVVQLAWTGNTPTVGIEVFDSSGASVGTDNTDPYAVDTPALTDPGYYSYVMHVDGKPSVRFAVTVAADAPTLTLPVTGGIYTVTAAATVTWAATIPTPHAGTSIQLVWNAGASETILATDASAAYGGTVNLAAYAGQSGTLTARRITAGAPVDSSSVTVRVLGAGEHSWDYITNVFAAFLATDTEIDDTAGAITAWRADKGSFTLAPSANSPTYSATDCNGNPAANFDGSNDELILDTIATTHFPAGAATDVPFAIIMLVRNDTISNGDSYWGFGNSGDADSRHTFFQTTGGVVSTNRVANDNTGPGTISTTETINDTDWHVLTCRFLGTTTTTRIDGAATSVTATACDAGTLTLNRWTLGARRLNGAAGLFADVTIAAVVHATTLTDVELTAIENELIEHGGVT